jgi:signal transduction histidine kinase
MEANHEPTRDGTESAALFESVVSSGARAGRHRSAILIAVCALALIIAFRIYEDFYDTRALRVLEQARAASRATSRLLAIVLDAETGQRGYFLTGLPSYLAPFRSAVASMPGVLEQFRRATESLPIDKSDGERAEELAKAKIAELSRTVQLMEEHKNAAALQIVMSGSGDALMQQLRDVGMELERSYDHYAAVEHDSSETRREVSLAVTAGGILLAGAILILAGERLSRSSAEQYRLLLRIAEREQQYQRLADRLQVIREEEREHLAREIHDVLGQSLTGIKLDLSAVGRRLESGNHQIAIQKLREGSAAVDESIRLLQKIATELRPPLLDHIGLAAAIKAHAKEVTARTGLEFVLDLASDMMPLTADQRIALYRIYQESLTNIIRHAGATSIWVTLLWNDSVVRLQVKDDGKGFNVDDTIQSLGLLGMRERARLVAADFVVSSQQEKGTVVEVSLTCAQPV